MPLMHVKAGAWRLMAASIGRFSSFLLSSDVIDQTQRPRGPPLEPPQNRRCGSDWSSDRGDWKLESGLSELIRALRHTLEARSRAPSGQADECHRVTEWIANAFPYRQSFDLRQARVTCTS